MKKVKILFISILVSGSAVFCQNSDSASALSKTVHNLKINEAVDLALENNISIKQSKLSLKLLEKQDKYSWNSVSPSLSVGSSFSDSLPTGEGSSNSMSYSVSGSASLRFTPSLFTTIRAAQLAYENGEKSLEDTKRSVELSVRQTFYSLLNMEETINSTQKSLDAAKRTYDSNLIKYNRGQMDQLSLLTSQYNYESKIPSMESAKNSYQNTLDSFKQVLGIDLKDEVKLDGSLDDILDINLSEDILNSDLDKLPAVVSIYQNIKVTENSLAAARHSAYGPSVSASYSYSGGGGIQPSNGYSTRNNSVGVNVSIPLDGYLPWSSGALSIENQKKNLENYKLQLENAKTSAAITIRSNYNTIKNAQSQLKTYEANLELMQRTYEMTNLAYANGSKDLNALQTAEDNLASARRSVQQQKYTIINAVLSLENTLGVPFGTLDKQE